MDVARSVFISYSGEDQAVGEQVCRLLEEQGIPCWMAPRNVRPGHDYGEQIIDAIESTRVMVLVLSEHANTSIFVKNEVERAISKGKVVIPLRIQNVQPSRALELFVSRSQWVDAWAPPMESRVAVLGAAIRGLLGLPPLEESPATPGAGAGAVTGMGTGTATGATTGPFMPTTQVPSPPPLAARQDLSSRVAGLPRSTRIAAVIGLVAVLGLGGLMATGGLGGHATATATPTTGNAGLRTNVPEFSVPAALPGQPTSKPGGQANGTAIEMPQVAISAGNATQVGQLGLWDKQGASDLLWSADGKTLAVNSGRGLTLLNPATLAETGSLDLGGGGSIAASADWKIIAAANNDGVQLWSIDGAQLTDKLAGSKGTTNAAVSPDGKHLVTQTGTTVKLWDVATGKELQTLVSSDMPYWSALVFSPDGKTLAGSDGVGVKAWDTSSWKPISIASCAYEPSRIAFSPDGKTMAVTAVDNAVHICDVATGRQQRTFAADARLVAFSPDGSLLLVSSSRTTEMHLWSVASGTDLATLTGHSSDISGMGFSQDGKLIASAGSDGLRLWGVRSASPSPTVPASPIAAVSMPSIPISPNAITPSNAVQLKQAGIWDKGRVYLISYSPDGKSMAVATDENVSVLDAETQEVQRQLPVGAGYGLLAVARDWSTLAVEGNDGVGLWDMNGAQLATLTGSKGTTCAAFSPDHRFLATCTGSAIKIWDVASGENVQTLAGDLGSWRVVAFTPGGKTLISGGSSVAFWDTSTWKQVHKTDGAGSFEAMAVAPDGSLVAVGSSFGGVTVYKVATGLQQRSFSGQELIHSMAFSPDGSLIASASWNNSVQVLDVAGGKVVKTISEHSDRAEAVAFSPDGATLATGSLDSTLRLWRVGP